jgi:hypothetical protein
MQSRKTTLAIRLQYSVISYVARYYKAHESKSTNANGAINNKSKTQSGYTI